MKSQCGAVSSGRVTRPRKDMENEEIQVYLTKLKDLVPFMPRNRRLTKLEVIQYVIDYIVDLQEALEGPAALQAAAAVMVSRAAGGDFTVGSNPTSLHHHSSSRQPLGVLAPNTILPTAVVSATTAVPSAPLIPPATTCSSQEAGSAHGRLLEKSSPPDPTIRPVSV